MGAEFLITHPEFRRNVGLMHSKTSRLGRMISVVSVWAASQGACLAQQVEFFTDVAEYRLGESVMIPLRSASAVGETTTVDLETDKQGVVEVLRKPEFLKGQSTGFARIRTLAPGEVSLRSGGSRMRVKVLNERSVALLQKMRPRFTSPPEGSCVWGTVAIGVDIWVGVPGVDRAAKPEALLHLPDGRKLDAVEAFPPLDGPFWRMVYHLDAASLPPGDCVLKVTCKPPVEGGGKMEPLVSDDHPLTILAAPGKDDIIFSGECEDTLNTPRNERMGMEPPGVALESSASGYRAVGLRRARPAWMIQPDIQQPGRYQLMVRARGSLVGAAYPSLGVVLGENASDSGSVRLVSSSWHQVPVGLPVQLGKGPQWIGVALANEFSYRNQTQRVADIDSFELRRVPDAASGTGGGMMMEAGMMMREGGDKTTGDKNKAPVARGLRVAFTTLHDGETINGLTEIRASLNSPALKNERDYQAIRTDLWVNDGRLASAHGRDPVFRIHPHDLKKGANRLELHASSPCGNNASSLSQTLIADSAAHPSKELETGFDADRYDLNRKGWDKIKKTEIAADHALAEENGPRAVHLFAQGGQPVRLALPDDLTGKRRLSIHARGTGVLSVKLHQAQARHQAQREMEIGRITLEDKWTWQPLASIDLAQGRKTVSIELIEGDAALAGFSIDTPKFIDASPPVVEVLYPKPGAVISSAGDAIVVKAFDDLRLSHFEVFIDGRKTPLALPVTRDAGPLLLHLPASVLTNGPRKIEVIAFDTWGKQTRSKTVPVTVRANAGPVLTLAWPRAVRLSTTLGYGMDEATLVRILTTGEKAWLTDQTNTPWGGAHDPLVEALAMTWFPEGGDYQVRGRVVTDLLATRNPVRARFVLFAQNHFSTWMAKTGAVAKWEEHRTFRNTGIARFQDLLLTSATSPAMMVYLDQQNSLGRQLNENYAREVMELHTVGVHGGYQQGDVTSLAHLLTGWGAQREATADGGRVDYNYRFSPYLNEGAPLEVFGLSIPAAQSPETADDRIRMIVEMLACRPETARFIAEKMVSHYLGMPVDEATVETLAAEFLHSGGDMRRIMVALVESPRFMAAELQGKLMTPVEFGVAHQRSAAALHPWAVIGLGDRSGRNLFDRASPDGFPETNEDYADSNYQLQKWSYCKELEHGLSGSLPQGWFDADALKDPNHADAVIDHAFAVREGRAPSPATRDALRAILRQDIADPNHRRYLFASFLHMMPEFQTR
jgi:hypothetical protein